MKIEEFGEKAFLDSLLPKLTTTSDFLNGFGHDASILDIGLADTAIAMKIDRAGKPVATINGWADYRLWGRLAVTANCSDILAVGGVPKGFMIAISVPRTFDAKAVEQIVMGAEEECLRNGVTFLGGDTKESNEPQVVGSAVGIVRKNYYFGRKVAKRGDFLVLAGSLGGFVGSYIDSKESANVLQDCIEYMAYPRARWNEAEQVNSQKLAIGGMDLSDGLFDALQSMVSLGHGALIDIESLPYHSLAKMSARKYAIPLLNLAFGVGDWAILYAISPDQIDAVRLLGKEEFIELTVIGRVIDEEGIYGIDSYGEAYEIDGIINENFKSRMEDQSDYFMSIKSDAILSSLLEGELKQKIADAI